MQGNTVNGAYFAALRRIKMADALGAYSGINFVNLYPLVNSVVGAFRLTNVAVYALIGNH
jgi:hypothetical protein